MVLAILVLATCECLPPQPDGGTINIASFNIQVFGQTKASKPEVMEILAERIPLKLWHGERFRIIEFQQKELL